MRVNGVISHEHLQMANMVRNHHLAKGIQDAGWSVFLSILAAKAAYAGRRVVAAPPAYTSQQCSGPHCARSVASCVHLADRQSWQTEYHLIVRP
jgi:IS605 OrfB family transposase